jgi:transcriptional regulator with XRE-family HTH domain
VLLTSEQIRAARMLLRWEQKDLAASSKLSLATIKRLETQPGPVRANEVTIAAIARAFSDAGVEFTNGDTPGVRFRPGR